MPPPWPALLLQITRVESETFYFLPPDEDETETIFEAREINFFCSKQWVGKHDTVKNLHFLFDLVVSYSWNQK